MNLSETNLLAALLDTLPIAVIGTDRHDRIHVFNPAAEAVLGWKTEDAIGLSALELWASPSEARVVRRHLKEQKSENAGFTKPIEVSFRHRDGKHIQGRLYVALLTDTWGDPVGILGILEDRRKELADGQALGAAAAQIWEAEQRMAALGRMVRALHGLQQPLTAALGLSELMQDQGAASPERLQRLHQALERLSTGISDLSALLSPPPPTLQRKFT